MVNEKNMNLKEKLFLNYKTYALKFKDEEECKAFYELARAMKFRWYNNRPIKKDETCEKYLTFNADGTIWYLSPIYFGMMKEAGKAKCCDFADFVQIVENLRYKRFDEIFKDYGHIYISFENDNERKEFSNFAKNCDCKWVNGEEIKPDDICGSFAGISKTKVIGNVSPMVWHYASKSNNNDVLTLTWKEFKKQASLPLTDKDELKIDKASEEKLCEEF